MPLVDGQVVAGYTILRTLGAGGMGEVYLVQHPRLPRYDALKVLGSSVSRDDEYRQRFNLEADMVSTLTHPHIVTIYDRGEFDDKLWIAMEFVDGTDASHLLADRYPYGMPPDEVVRIITAVAEALDYAHGKGLLHRDVKPANILLGVPDSGDDRVMLADFGIARWIGQASGLTGTNMTVGTVAYAAPEQLKGDDMDGHADQYALAATAYHLLTGMPPFQHTNPAIVISQHLSSDPPAIGNNAARTGRAGSGVRQGAGQGRRRPLPALRRLRARSAPGPRGGRIRVRRRARDGALTDRRPAQKGRQIRWSPCQIGVRASRAAPDADPGDPRRRGDRRRRRGRREHAVRPPRRHTRPPHRRLPRRRPHHLPSRVEWTCRSW